MAWAAARPLAAPSCAAAGHRAVRVAAAARDAPAGPNLGATRRRGRPRKHPSGPAPAPAADSPLQPTAAGEGLANGSAPGSSSGSGIGGGPTGVSSSVMQRRADDMLRGELLSSLLKRRGISTEDGSADGSSSGGSSGSLSLGSPQQQAQRQPEPEPEWSLPPFVPPQPEPPAVAAATYLQQEQRQQEQLAQLQQLEQERQRQQEEQLELLRQLVQQEEQQQQQPGSAPPSAAAAAPAMPAAPAVPAVRRRGRPRKSPVPPVPPGSSLVAAAEGAAEGLAENYGAAVALAAYQDTLSRQPLVDVSFCLRAKLDFGTRVRVVGGHECLGTWRVEAAPELVWSEGDQWRAQVKLPAGAIVEYKYVLLESSGGVRAWQSGANNVLAVKMSEERIELFDTWQSNPDQALVVSDGGAASKREGRLMAWAGEMMSQLSAQRQEMRRMSLELAGSQQELREARERAEFFRGQYAAKEAERKEAAAQLSEARALNTALQSQLQDTTGALKEAIETASALLQQVDARGAEIRSRRRSRAAAEEADSEEAED